MSMRRPIALAMIINGVCLMNGVPSYAEEQSPNLGTPISEQQAGSSIIWPDGRGLPAGQGSVSEGKRLYQVHCLACHGVSGQDGVNDVLAGGHVDADSVPLVRTVGSYWPYATTLFDYVRRSMPYRAPGSLQPDEVYSLVAFLLYLNQVVEEDAEMDATTLQAIELPNKIRFYSEYILP